MSERVKRDRGGRTALHYAASDGNIESVRTLIAGGADVNAQDSEGWSPLHFAAQANSTECLVELLGAGASVDIKDYFGNTPLFRAAFSSRGEGGVIDLLRCAGADPTVPNLDGVSPVMLARTIKNYDVARFFADVEAG